MEIKLPTSNTTLSLNIADMTVSELSRKLKIVSEILEFLYDNAYELDPYNEVWLRLYDGKSAEDIPLFGVSYEPWDDDSVMYSGGIINSVFYIGKRSIGMDITPGFLRFIQNNPEGTFHEYVQEQLKEVQT